MKTNTAIIIGISLLVSSISHALLSTSSPKPLHTGYVQGEIYKEESNGIAHLKCDGFKVECYETFVLVFVDKEKEPTWTDNYVLTLPWSKIQHMTLKPA